jgi:hypothetical protein
MPWSVSALLWLLAAMCLGVFADEGQRLPGTWSFLPALGSPWLVLAFGGARLISLRNRAGSVLFGTGFVVVGLLNYLTWVHGAYGVDYYNLLNTGRGIRWFLLAAMLGASSAIAGAFSRGSGTWMSAGGWGYVVAVPIAETRYVSDWVSPVVNHAILTVLCLGLSAALLARALWVKVAPAKVLITSLVWIALGMASASALIALNLL